MSVLSSLASVIGNFGGAAIGGIGGAAMRLVPEGIKFFDDREQRKHELAMTKVQLDIDKARSEQALDLAHVQGEAADHAGNLAALLESIKAQAQPTGVKWVDALSATVRPLTTYWIFGIYSVYKATVIWGAWRVAESFEKFGALMWTPDDVVMLSGVLSFWYVSREMGKMKAR